MPEIVPSIVHLIAAYLVVAVGLGAYVLALHRERGRLAREIAALAKDGEYRTR